MLRVHFKSSCQEFLVATEDADCERGKEPSDADGRPRYKDSNHFRATFVAEQIRFLDRLFPARE